MPAAMVVAVPRMRARSSGARGLVGVRAAIVRVHGNCVRVCRGDMGCGGCGCGCGFEMQNTPGPGGLGVFWEVVFGGVLLSHTLSSAVPSALEGLASGFGMGPGVSPPLWPP